jgi:hypothetical protein
MAQPRHKCNRRDTNLITTGLVLLFAFTLSMTFVTQAMESVLGATEGSSDIPNAVCIIDDKEYSMVPYFVREEGRESASVIRFPEVAGESRPDLTIDNGQRITIEMDESPSKLTASLVDTDSDDVTAETLESVGENTFEISSESLGTKSLQALATLDDGREVSYAILLTVDSKEDIENGLSEDNYVRPTIEE